ncbi:MAG: hypothetical protein C0423_03565 [Methylibium sp.]|nr:hypothetical protein [Methylibium sp.]
MKTRRLTADAIVLGAGPAGMAAVQRLLESKVSVIWVDNQARPGGQIWRGGPQAASGAALLRRIDAGTGLTKLHGHELIAADGKQSLLLHDGQGQRVEVSAPKLLLATGASERHLPLPGWTLPGVHGAGGLQALVKGGWPIAGQQVVLAGSGPLLLASAATLQAAGARLQLIAEQAALATLIRFTLQLPLRQAAQAAALRLQLRATPYRSGCWPVRVLGRERVQAVLLTDGQREWEQPCDALGLGFGLRPNTEVAELLGCQISAGAVALDDQLQTTQHGIYAAGECTGIGGVGKALIEGEMAAASLLGQDLAPLRSRQRNAQKFAKRLAAAFTLRPELFKLADAQTLICRCEDVSLGALKPHPDWREAKLQTRCGMGACQGRICGPISTELLGWQARGLREPLSPAPVSCWLPD